LNNLVIFFLKIEAFANLVLLFWKKNPNWTKLWIK